MVNDSNQGSPKLLDVKEVAARIKYSERRVREFLNHNTLHGNRVGPNNKWLIPESEITRFLEGKTEPPQPDSLISKVEEKHPIESETTTNKDLARRRDIEVFKQSEEILDDEQFDKLFKFLYRTCFTLSQMNRIETYINFFDSEVNKYIDMSLRYSNFKLIVKLKEIFSFLEEYSVEYIWYERLIDEGKLKGDFTRTWSHINTLVEQEPDTAYLSRFSNDFQLLLHRPDIHGLFEIHYQDTDVNEYHYPAGDFPESYRDWEPWYQNLKVLIEESKSAYNEYRSYIRDLLYI